MKMLKPAMADARQKSILAIGIISALSAIAAQGAEEEMSQIQEIVVLGESTTFSTANTTESMERQQNPITSVLSHIDNLPGVNITEGDTFGFDDWSTTINLRGYQTNLSEQQVGTTIDGLPNGESNYGGGAKANRYIDTMNSGGVEVNQGTADISSRTLEALGGTLNFLTDDPLQYERFRTSFSSGDFSSNRYYGRYDTGMLLDETTRAWVSVSHNEATDWMEGSAQNERDHVALKFITELEDVTFTGYASYDDIQEDNYQRITPAEFDANPNWDRLTGDWTGVPYVDQLYRRGWSTNRSNKFAYLKTDWVINPEFTLNLAVYGHNMTGRGDWVPPYIVDVADDGIDGHSELVTGNVAYGGAALSRLFFVDATGNALAPNAGCVSSITFPYGGAGPEYDPACYGEGAIAVQSFRHTHYERDRLGYTADFEWITSLGNGAENSLRGGLWYEDSTRSEFRDWHKITDTTAGFQFETPAYWVQYDLEFPRDTLNWYLSDTVTFGDLSLNLGIREFSVETDRKDNFGVAALRSLESDTDILYSTGFTYQFPAIAGLEVFGGYSENVKPLTGNILEREGTDLSNLDAETAENMELGLRFVGDRFIGSAVWFDNQFDNRLEFFSNQLAGNIPNYLIGTSGSYDNVGGIETSGVEFAVSAELTENWSLYGSYTYTDATYLGTGLGTEADAALGLVPGNQVVGTPENMWVVSLDWLRGNYSAGVSTKFVDDRFINRANTSIADGYTVSDFYFNINGEGISDFLQGMQIGFVVNNLTDNRYLGGISGFGSWIGAPRTAVFTLTADF